MQQIQFCDCLLNLDSWFQIVENEKCDELQLNSDHLGLTDFSGFMHVRLYSDPPK